MEGTTDSWSQATGKVITQATGKNITQATGKNITQATGKNIITGTSGLTAHRDIFPWSE